MSRACVVLFLGLGCAPPGVAGGTEATGSTSASTTAEATTGEVSTTVEPTTGEGSSTSAAPCDDPACDTILQNCPSGQKCTGVKPSLLAPYAGTACVPDNAGQGSAAGSICFNAGDGSDTCDPGSMCMQFGTGEGACVPFCVGAADAPGCDEPGQVCARVDHVWPINGCVPACDPLNYACADAELNLSAMVCQPAAVGFGCVLRGHLEGRELGEPCEDHRDCIAAARCAPPDEVPGCPGPAGCCAAYCDLSAPACPHAQQSCVAYYGPGEAPPGLDDVGLCAAP